MSKGYYISRNLWRDLYAIGALSDAELLLESIEKASAQGDHETERLLWLGFFTTYARPFTNNDDMGRITDNGVPPKLRKMHEMVIAARNQLYGHTNPLEKADDGGVMNQILFIKSAGRISISVTKPRPDPELIPDLKALTSAVIADLHSRTREGVIAAKEKLRDQPDGRYEFQYPIKPTTD